jgi:hypothetical protein
MTARIAAVAALIVLAGAGCGGQSRHDAVSKYLTEVNAIQAKFAAPLLAVSTANRDFALPHSNPVAVRRQLLTAAQRIDTVRGELADLSAPSEAAPLKKLLMQLATRESALAREVARLATFLPVFQSTLQPLATAGKLLKQALSGKGSLTVKANALDAYSSTLGDVLVRVRKLRPPPVSAAIYASQVTTLERVRASTTALAKALREKRNKDIPVLLRRFNLAAVGNQSLAAQHAQIQAVRSYNARISGLDSLSIRISREQVRLQRSLG